MPIYTSGFSKCGIILCKQSKLQVLSPGFTVKCTRNLTRYCQPHKFSFFFTPTGKAVPSAMSSRKLHQSGTIFSDPVPKPGTNIITDTKDKETSITNKTKPNETENVNTKSENQQSLSRKDKLKQAVKDYGSTVIVFHVAMSLCSLGVTYLLVSSGLDMVAILKSFGVGEKALESGLTQGASTFVIAYAVHKVFAPVRIGITLTATPLIVKKLRSIGFLKVKT